MPALFLQKKALMVAWSYIIHRPNAYLGYWVLGIKPKNLQQERRICQAIFNQKQNGKKPKVKTLTNIVLTYWFQIPIKALVFLDLSN